jgi:hypothetical protein
MSFAPREYLRHIADEAAYLEQATEDSDAPPADRAYARHGRTVLTSYGYALARLTGAI